MSIQIRAGLVNDGSTWTNTNWFTISDSLHSIELDWRAATATGANNGALTVWTTIPDGSIVSGWEHWLISMPVRAVCITSTPLNPAGKRILDPKSDLPEFVP